MHFFNRKGPPCSDRFAFFLPPQQSSCAAAAADGQTQLATIEKGSLVKVFPKTFLRDLSRLEKSLKVIASGTAVATRKGRDLVPEADFAMALDSVRDAMPGLLPDLSYETVEVSREDALKFLSRDPVTFPAAPRGYLLLTYKGLGLGFVKNLGNRTNSLLPPARRIRMRP